MRNFAVFAMLFLLPFVAAAQAETEKTGPLSDDPPGLSIMERGAQLFLEGILKEMQPAIDEFSELVGDVGPALRSFAIEMGPKLRDILEQVDDWRVYEAPEILPNGDIIIRRKPRLDIVVPDDSPPQVEL